MVNPLLQSTIPLLDALQCGAAIVDRAGVFVHVNARLAEMFGLPRPQIIGQHVKTFYGQSEGWQQIRASLRDFDQPHENENYVPRPDGTRIPVVVASKPMGDEPPLNEFMIVTVVDISSQVEAYKHLSELGDTILGQALELRDYNKHLEQRVAERTAELHEANMDAIYMLAVASEAKDEDTGAHVRRIQGYAEAVAKKLGLDDEEARRIGYSAILHDVGKIHVPDQILKKPGPLDAPERQEMEKHTLAGEAILSERPFFALARQIARSHHENFDGSGYPERIKGDAIPLAARIVHVVDVFDALSSKRVYKPAWPLDRAAENIHQGSGKLFDPAVAKAFDDLYDTGKITKIRSGCGGEAGKTGAVHAAVNGAQPLASEGQAAVNGAQPAPPVEVAASDNGK